jgi:hypothetical protein
MVQKLVIYDDNGMPRAIEPLTTSTGAADAGKVPGLGPDGRFNDTLMPAGIGADVFTAVAFEALSAGDFVNLFADSGVASVRKADNSNGRAALGFVLEAVAPSATATVQHLGEANSALSGLTVGANYWLGTAGGVTATPIPPASTGKTVQYLGVAKSATELLTVFAQPLEL